jgi:hypothetical protein
MLNKEICKKCINKRRIDVNKNKQPWNKEDEKHWESGKFWCSRYYYSETYYDRGFINVTEEAKISKCFYKLEQLLKKE